MKEAIVKPGTKVDIIDSPIPKAAAGQVVIKIVVTGTNPKDWKYSDWNKVEMNAGDDIAGTIHEVGAGVTEFKVGDRVAAFHEMLQPHGSFAEYGVAWAYTTFHIPESLSYEDASTIPLAAMTAIVGLFHHLMLDLPAPWQSQQTSKKPLPLLVYGGATAVGSFVIQIAKQAGIHPIITVAGNGIEHVNTLLDKSKGDVVIDYRKGDAATVDAVKAAAKAAGAGGLLYAYDAVSTKQTQSNCANILEQGGKLTVVLPPEPAPSGITVSRTYVGAVHAMDPATDEDRDFGEVYFRYLARGLRLGWLKAHPTQVVPGGLTGLEKALKTLKDGKSSAVKFVARIADTPGVGR